MFERENSGRSIHLITEIFHMIRDDNVDRLRKLLEVDGIGTFAMNAEYDLPVGSHGIPLQHALKNSSFKAANFLLEHGAEFDSDYLYFNFENAFKEANFEALQFLTNHGLKMPIHDEWFLESLNMYIEMIGQSTGRSIKKKERNHNLKKMFLFIAENDADFMNGIDPIYKMKIMKWQHDQIEE